MILDKFKAAYKPSIMMVQGYRKRPVAWNGLYNTFQVRAWDLERNFSAYVMSLNIHEIQLFLLVEMLMLILSLQDWCGTWGELGKEYKFFNSWYTSKSLLNFLANNYTVLSTNYVAFRYIFKAKLEPYIGESKRISFHFPYLLLIKSWTFLENIYTFIVIESFIWMLKLQGFYIKCMSEKFTLNPLKPLVFWCFQGSKNENIG